MIGADMTAGLTESRLTVILGHAFAERWSMEGRLGVAFGHIMDKEKEEEALHEDEFDMRETEHTTEDRLIDTGAIALCFWAARAYYGSFISIGGVYRGKSPPELTLGTGYVIHIWKGLSASVSFNIDIMETYRNASIRGDGISVAICCIF